MAEDRTARAQRVLAVQKQLYRMEEWKLAELQRQLADLEREQHELIGTLNTDAALQGLFIDAMARRLRSLSDAAGRVERERAAQAQIMREAGARVGIARRLSDRLDRQAARDEEKKDLGETIERLSAQASRKINGG